MPPSADPHPTMDSGALRQEQRNGRLAGGAALLAVLGNFVALVLAASETTSVKIDGAAEAARQQLRDVHAAPGTEVAVASVRALAALLVIPIALHLYAATRARDADASPPWVRLIGIAGPILLALATIAGYITLRSAAQDFVSGADQSAAHARALITDRFELRASFWFERAAYLVFGTWTVLASLHAMRTGLLTRGIGIWGIAAGVVSAFLPVGAALFIGWLASIAVIAIGWWPGGMPPAWSEGRAIRADDERRQPLAGR